jgi:7-cyano-7-deazaguanine synthase
MGYVAGGSEPNPLARRDDLVFWTGGFDSTFRILERLFNEGLTVTPVYVIDRSRPSYPVELATMAKLRTLIEARGAGDRLTPLQLFLRDDFPPGPEITAAMAEISAQARVPPQNSWLAQFAHSMGFGPRGIEIGTHKHESVPGHYHRICFENPYTPEYSVKPGAPEVLMGGFALAVFHREKSDMRRIARESGFEDILDRTWFCHSPIGGKPCGVCRPCAVAREQRPEITEFARFGGLHLAAVRHLRRLRHAASHVYRRIVPRDRGASPARPAPQTGGRADS